MGARKEKIILLTILVASAVIALGSGAGVYLLQKKAGVLEQQNTALEGRVAKARTKINKLPELRAERERAEARLVIAERILPSQEEIENLVDNLSEFARESGVVITEAAPFRQSGYRGGQGGAKKFEEANFSLSIEGNFFQFVKFLNLLENYKRFIKVDGFTVKSGKDPGKPHEIELTFTTFTYTSTNAQPARRGT